MSHNDSIKQNRKQWAKLAALFALVIFASWLLPQGAYV